jgi:hypothetical protein
MAAATWSSPATPARPTSPSPPDRSTTPAAGCSSPNWRRAAGATFLAGTDAPLGLGAQTDPQATLALDSSGGGVLAGSSVPVDFPVTPGAFDTTHNGLDEGFVTRFDARGWE